MRLVTLAGFSAAGLLAATQAPAVSSPVTAQVEIAGEVAPLCSVGSPADGSIVFNLGTLIDTATGLLLPNLGATKTLDAAFCNSLSTISVTATPMRAQAFADAPPDGFAASVDFTATASGWSTAPAIFLTSLSVNPDAIRSVPGAFAADIVISLSQFTAVGGPTLALVADPAYQGTLTITVAIAT